METHLLYHLEKQSIFFIPFIVLVTIITVAIRKAIGKKWQKLRRFSPKRRKRKGNDVVREISLYSFCSLFHSTLILFDSFMIGMYLAARDHNNFQRISCTLVYCDLGIKRGRADVSSV